MAESRCLMSLTHGARGCSGRAAISNVAGRTRSLAFGKGGPSRNGENEGDVTLIEMGIEGRESSRRGSEDLWLRGGRGEGASTA